MRTIRSTILAVTLLVTLSLAACAVPAASPATSPLDQPATSPLVEPTTGATPIADEEPTTVPSESPLEEPTPAADGEELDAGALVRQILAQQLQLNLDQIEIVSVEAVDWPDACLGVYTADMMCAQVITPGYRVILAVDGQQYEYHTNLDGSSVQLASAPEANVGEILIEWQQTQDTCQSAQFGTEGIVYGPCMGVQMGGKLLTEMERDRELADFIETYAPFETETSAGIITFHGQGSTEATPAEQRMITEWARQASQEAAAGRSAASWGLAFAWHREGGIAGFCDDLTTYVTGNLYASTCKNQPPRTLTARRMTPDELEQIYAWVDEYAPFEFEHTDKASADAMTIRLVFSGAGSTSADEATQQAILGFAADLYSGSAAQ
jgi:hypothetical protein